MLLDVRDPAKACRGSVRAHDAIILSVAAGEVPDTIREGFAVTPTSLEDAFPALAGGPREGSDASLVA